MKKYTVAIFFISLLVLLVFVGIPFTDKQSKNDFKKFNEARLSGLIEYVTIKHHGDCFKLQNDLSEYVFFPEPAINQDSVLIFSHLARKGDQVSKIPYSDTLVLTNNGKKYFFLFKQ